ncbi:MAG: zinc finger domain-containing protein [Candidatus Dormibacteria bacterium]
MNETETGRFLTMVITLDPKMPQPDTQGFMRKLWARQLAEVPFEAADRAMQAYYRSDRYVQNREPISPGDVVQWWNARRRPNDRERRGGESRVLPRASFDLNQLHAGVDRCITALAESKAVKDGADIADAADIAEGDAAARRSVLAVACPHCKASSGLSCMRVGSKIDERVPLQGYHPSRVELAQREMAA